MGVEYGFLTGPETLETALTFRTAYISCCKGT